MIELTKFCKTKGFILPSKYLSYNSFKDFIFIMADEQQSQIVDEINLSPFFSLALDGSTDLGKTKSMVINVLYLYENKPKWVYLHSLFVENGCAKTIYNALIAMFKDLGIKNYKGKLLSLCSDGERALCSSKEGVLGLLTKEIPTLLGIHCLSHKFSLASKTDLNEKYPILEEIYQLVYDTYKYFNSSSNRINELFENEKDIEDLTSQLNLERSISIRWASLFTSINRLAKVLKAVIVALKKQKDLTSKTLLCYYADPRFLLWIHFLADISFNVGLVTVSFQEKHFNLESAIRTLRCFKDTLHSRYIDSFDPGRTFSKFMEKITLFKDNLVFDNVLVLERDVDLDFYKAEFKSFCTEYLKAIDKRFKDVNDLYAFEFFNIEYLQNHSNSPKILQDFANYAPDLLKKLKFEDVADEIIEGYPYIVDYFKHCVTTEDTVVTIYRELLSDYSEKFPNLMKLITMYQIVPWTSVECESCFSEQSRTKTRLRASMEDEMLASLLQLRMNQKTNDNPELFIHSSIHRWNAKKKRYFFNPETLKDLEEILCENWRNAFLFDI